MKSIFERAKEVLNLDDRSLAITWLRPGTVEDFAQAVVDFSEALKFISERENLTFAECSIAEEIVGKARAALEKHSVRVNE